MLWAIKMIFKTLFDRFMWALVVCFLVSNAFALDGTLIVANRTGGSISFIDLNVGVEVARLPVGPIIPHEVAVSPDGRFALTSEYGPNDRPGQHVLLIDISNASLIGRIDLGPNSRPHTVLFLPDGRRAIATMQDSDQLALIDIALQQVIRLYPTGGREGHMARLSPDGSRAYVASRLEKGTLSVVFLDEERDPVVIETGLGAEGLDVSMDGSEIWVANRQERSISIIDADSLEVVSVLDSRPLAGRIDIGSEGYAVVPNGNTRGTPVSQYLRLFNVQSRELVVEVPLRDGSPQNGNFGVLVQDDVVFASDPHQGTIQTFTLDGLVNRQVLISNHDGPDGMAWTPIRLNAMIID